MRRPVLLCLLLFHLSCSGTTAIDAGTLDASGATDRFSADSDRLVDAGHGDRGADANHGDRSADDSTADATTDTPARPDASRTDGPLDRSVHDLRPLPELPATVQRSVVFDLSAGFHDNTAFVGGELKRVGPGPGTWTSAPVDTRADRSGVAYSMWEGVHWEADDAEDVVFGAQTRAAGVDWSDDDWSDLRTVGPDDPDHTLASARTVQAPQDRLLRVRLRFPAESSARVRRLSVEHAAAFAFELDPFHAGPTEVDRVLPPASRRVVVRDGHFAYDNEDGSFERARFYAIQLFTYSNLPSHAQADQMCVNLRRRGFNSIKTHVVAHSGWTRAEAQARTIVKMFQEGDRPDGVINAGSGLVLDDGMLDRLDYLLHRCAEEGLYTYLRLLSPAPHLEDTAHFTAEELAIRPRVDFSEYFVAGHRDFHRAFYTRLLEHVNPYRELAYKDDPAIAFYELTNENTLFRAWYSESNRLITETMEDYPEISYSTYAPMQPLLPAQSQLLDERWNLWLLDRYGGHADGARAGILAAWGEGRDPPEDWGDGGLRPYEDPAAGTVIRTDTVWTYPDGTPGHKQTHRGRDRNRFRDMAEFYRDLEIAFFGGEQTHIKEDLGAQGLLVGSNLYRDTYSLESQATTDFVDTHAYWRGIGACYRPMLREIDGIGASILSRAARSKMRGKPLSVSEYNGFAFSPYDAEILPVVASYAALQGWDSITLFDYLEHSLDDPANFRIYQHASYFDPVKMVQAPLTGRAFSDWIRPADTTVAITYAEADRPDHAMSAHWYTLANEGNWNYCRYQPNNVLFRHAVAVAGFDGATTTSVDDLAALGLDPYCGAEGSRCEEQGPCPVHQEPCGSSAGSCAATPACPPPWPQIESDTGELYVDAETGLFYPLHPRLQGAVGLIGGATHDRPPDVEITVASSAYQAGAVLLGSLDDQPLTTSQRILVTASARSENYGILWRHDRSYFVHDTGNNQQQYGTRPVLTTGLAAEVLLRTERTDLVVHTLNVDGQLGPAVPSRREPTGLRFSLSPDDETLWYLVLSS